ncbi:uncharacterized protein LOC126896349 isoform X2 [Daktulosphaira vitifoliae]|uniref:uncharacterized protein LOC126896349 isoform X2 n=1 Tax=Daktulosphaira vitifoliae TaxID=58002 RepID=UPI0021AA5EF7|nr:uncharacterized protein LOC126896349 isoform X2 [Daktulosphaira vitifoliae]
MGNYCSSKPKDRNGSDEYLQKAHYKKNQKKADKSTNVISVDKRKSNDPLQTVITNNNAESNPNVEESSNNTKSETTVQQPTISVENTMTVQEKQRTYTLPDELKCVTTDIKKLLLGIPEPDLSHKSNKIVVYINFPSKNGFDDERSVLHEKIFPCLRSKCTGLGYELHVVDFNVDEEVERACQNIHMKELRRGSEISFVVSVIYIDDTLGLPVLPQTVALTDYELVKSRSDASRLLEKWYSLDEKTNSMTLKNESSLENDNRDQSKNSDEKFQLQMAMLKSFDSKLRSIYFGRVIENELYNEVVLKSELAKKSIWVIKNHDLNQKSKNTALELKKRLEQLNKQLKNELPESNIILCEDSKNDEFIKKISCTLLSIIDSIEKEHDKFESSYGVDPSLLEELRNHNSFSSFMSKNIVNPDDLIEVFKKYVTADAEVLQPLIVYGPPGSGKTTLLSILVQYCHHWNQNAAVLMRFANISYGSSTLEHILNSIVMQLNHLDTGKSTWFTHDIESYSKQIKTLLNSISAIRPIILVIDGIDQFNNNSADWIPTQLPKNTRIIVSVNESSKHIDKLRQNVSTESFVQVPYLTEQQIASMISCIQLNNNLKNHNQIKNCDLKNVTPLKLKSCLKSQNSIEPNEDWVYATFDSVESTLGKERVSIAIGFLCATQYGLLDTEAIQLLEDKFNNDNNCKSLSVVLFWSLLNELLSIFLFWFKTDRYTTVRWSNNLIAEIAARRYNSYIKLARPKLLAYFESNQSESPSTWCNKNLSKRRKLDECVHLMDGSISDYINNLDWILDKLNNGLILQLLDELSRHTDDPQTSFLKQFLTAKAPSMMHNGYQLYSQMSLYSPTEKYYSVKMDTPPFPTLMPLVPKLDNSNKMTFNVVKRLNENHNYAITVSTEQQEIGVWDVETCTKVRSLKGVPHPTAIKLIDNQRCIVLCERKLTVINLETGKVISKLKGVMNQNMPYFDLHSPTKLVALARSRMHVNLIDIETGTIEAYFKAGEDRFLNSLLVSGNGRIMVCGDETQKPFPLLVWNLTSRQLMYDLRIPFHEFITRLSAITHEGHYVCCVAQEVDEPGPNFIVVYDLQSGTLFKKWKPGVNCVSLDISSKDGCVLSGHENGRICIWDLTTGNCRWTLGAHIAPVTSLRLDPSGGSFISLDTHTRDRTIKLWSVNTGELISEYTPTNPITAFDILPGGQFIVVATSNSSYPTVLQLRGPSIINPEPQKNIYNDETLEVDLSLDFREDGR